MSDNGNQNYELRGRRRGPEVQLRLHVLRPEWEADGSRPQRRQRGNDVAPFSDVRIGAASGSGVP
jgi:hypothetical protein